MVAVAAGAYHCENAAGGANHTANGVEHIHQSVGRMGVIHNRRLAGGATQRLEAACHRHHTRHIDEHLVGIPAKQQRSAVYAQQIVGVEATGEVHLHLVAVEAQQCAVETTFNDTAPEIGVATK